MQSQKHKKGKNSLLKINSTTWYKDSHSLFDYESGKITQTAFQFSLHVEQFNLYRKKSSPELLALSGKRESSIDFEQYQMIGHVEMSLIKGGVKVVLLSPSCYREKNKNNPNEKQGTNESNESLPEREEEPYYIVSKIKKFNDDAAGYKLFPGMTLKLGRIEFYVSEYFNGSIRTCRPKDKNKAYFNDIILPFKKNYQQVKNACKICLDESQNDDNFLFNPCNCNGSCGTVHYDCLIQWINVKVKKQIIGGTLHYNFQKFECEVCKAEFPGYIEIEPQNSGPKIIKELISLERPKGNYIVLEGACQKEKSIMIIQNTPPQGIKLGRGHECEIRISDISVSRKHAMIKNINQQYVIFDNKSKFGTLVREESIEFELRSQEFKYLQIGRTIMTFSIV